MMAVQYQVDRNRGLLVGERCYLRPLAPPCYSTDVWRGLGALLAQDNPRATHEEHCRRMLARYKNRWNMETLFQVLEQAFASEQPRLGYPQAALLGFGVALVAYNLLAVVKAALRVSQGAEQVEREVWGITWRRN